MKQSPCVRRSFQHTVGVRRETALTYSGPRGKLDSPSASYAGRYATGSVLSRVKVSAPGEVGQRRWDLPASRLHDWQRRSEISKAEGLGFEKSRLVQTAFDTCVTCLQSCHCETRWIANCNMQNNRIGILCPPRTSYGFGVD